MLERDYFGAGLVGGKGWAKYVEFKSSLVKIVDCEW